MIRHAHTQRPILIILLLLLLTDCGISAAKSETPLKNIPDAFISIEPKTGSEYAIVVEKAVQQLSLFSYDGSYKIIFRMDCSTGKGSGAKLRSGDQKTPEGIYFFKMEHKKRDLAPMYGSRAFPTDYPNLLDRLTGRDGNAIWLHGTNKSLKPRDTNGCIALENRNIDKLKNYIQLNKTPIIIVDKLSYVPVDSVAKAKKTISRFILQWKGALSSGSYHDYLKFYDSEYLPDISWWTEWNRTRKNIKNSSQSFSIQSIGTSIYKHQGVYVVLFDQNLAFSGEERTVGTKKLFISNKGGRLRIIAEEYQAPSNKKKEYRKKNPFVFAMRKLKHIQKGDRDIEDLIDGWLKAWTSKDIKRYATYYAKNFRSQGGASLKEWLKYKDRLNRKYRYIRVSKDNLVVKKGKTKSTASFIQNYESNRFKSVSSKKLVLIHEDGRWKIYREFANEKKSGTNPAQRYKNS